MNAKSILIVFITVFVLGVVAIFAALNDKSFQPVNNTRSNSDVANEIPEANEFEPEYSVDTIVDGLTKPWDISFVSDDLFIYNLKEGAVRAHNISTNEDWQVFKLDEVYNQGEGGLLGGIVDFKFSENNYYYLCSNVQGPSVSVIRIKLSADFKTVEERKDIVTQIPSNSSGRHSGCRMAMDTSGHLWIGTGDIAVGTNAQDPKSLGGKILKVDRVGNAVQGNMTGEFDPRIFSFGHRNTQGIVLFDEPVGDIYGFTAEHGSSRDDEINLLKQGNFGWDPVPGYNESVDMTDMSKFPDAISAIWSSGDPTIAISGMTIIKGEEWGEWNNIVAIAVQKDRHIRLIKFDENYKIVTEKEIFKNEYGRIRTITQSPNGDIYFLTDNGGGSDKILRLTARRN